MSLKVLLADAGDILKSVLELSEEDQDIEVIHVSSGTDALLRIKELRPDVLIADVALPGVDGYSLCEIVHTEDDLAEMRSVLTGEEDTEIDNSRVEATASDGYLPKPFNAEKLLRHLGLAASGGEESEEEEDSEADFQMDVSDDMSFADVALGKSGQGDQTTEAGDAEDVQKEPESLDSILGLEDQKRDNVDIDLGGEEDEGVSFQASMDEPVQTEPLGMTESETVSPSAGEQNTSVGNVSADLASEEGQKLVEEIVRRLSDKVVREVAWEVVPDLAERIIKEALDKITK